MSIGAASILLGFTFFGLGTQTVTADTVIPDQQLNKASNTEKKNVSNESFTDNKSEAVAAEPKKQKKISNLIYQLIQA